MIMIEIKSPEHYYDHDNIGGDDHNHDDHQN